MSEYETDIVIIGAGPVGLFAVFEAGMLKMRCHVIDALDIIGGQCAALYPEKPIYDIPAYPKIDAIDLIAKLQEQAAPFSPIYHLGQQVVSFERLNSSEGRGVKKDGMQGFVVTTSRGIKIFCKAIIIAAGCGAFGPNRPPLANLEQYEGKSVFYMVSRKEDMRGKRIAIAGGGDSAVDWAISLADIAEHIYFIHRRAKFRAAPDSVDKLHKLADAGKVELVVPYQLKSLDGENGLLAAVNVATLDGDVKCLNAQVLLPFFGLAMELGPIANWGLNLDMNHISVDPTSCATNISGVFAIGDIATYKNKLKLILCGFAEAAQACHAIYPLVYPDTALHFEYSTSKGVGSNG